MTLCAMSAVFSAVFGTPITAAVFCIEVINVGVFYGADLSAVHCVIAYGVPFGRCAGGEA